MQAVSLLQQAQTAAKSGQRQQAHRLLQQAIRQDPDNHLVWLWLAKTSASAQASLDYVKQAQRLMPEDDLVIRARAWADRRVAAASQVSGDKTAQPAKATRPTVNTQARTLRRGAAVLLVLVLIVLAAFVGWGFARPGLSIASRSAEPQATAENATLDTQQEVRLASAPAVTQPTATATIVPTPPLILAKQVASQNNGPRSTWTPTPLPTDTPTPTPTPLPTFVSFPWEKPEGRPLGVGPDERWVDVDLSEQTLFAYEGNSLIFETLISSGLPGHETVTGQFRVWYRAASQTMDGTRLGYDYYLDNVPYVMYFFEDYALHGTYWHHNFGHPMSHGCVNMRTEDAAWVFEWAKIGTVVNVHQ